MAEEVKTDKRKKPKFLRTDSHKRMRLGKGIKKNQKWRGAKGRQNKIRLGRKGHPTRPKIGWGAKAETKDFVLGLEAVRVENVAELGAVAKNQGIIIASVGLKKRKEIIKAANEKKIKILNKYKDMSKWI